jgi:hypothetical protein
MASSVSSEEAFLQGGITISKRCNHLKGDIVKALQCVKCVIRHDLLFREPGPSSLAEEELDEFEIEVEPVASADDDATEEEGWDTLFLKEDDNDMESEEMDETY